MAETSEVRLVRCPKCENLLPEISGFSFYQCGGCGAVLRAKDESCGNGSMLEKPDIENIGEDSAKSDNLLDKEIVDSNKPSNDIQVRSNCGSSRFNNARNFEKEHDAHKILMNNSMDTNGKGVFVNGPCVNKSKDKVVRLVGSDQEGSMSQSNYDRGSKFSGRMSDWRNGERDEIWRKSQADFEGVRFSTSNYLDGGASSSYSGFPYNHGEAWRSQREFDSANKVHNLEQDRAELLRKLDELKNQLSQQPSDTVNNPKEEVHVDERMVPPDSYGSSNNAWLSQRLSELNRTSRQFFRSDSHSAGGPSSFNYLHEPFAYANGHQMAMPNFHPSMHKPSYIPGYGDPFAPQIQRRSPHQLSHQISLQPNHAYYPGRFVDTNPDLYEPYDRNTMLHPPSCSCFNCYENRRRFPVPVPPTTLTNSRFPDASLSRQYGPNAHRFRGTSRPMNFHERQSHSRWSDEFSSEMAEYFRGGFQRVTLSGSSHHCRLIAGGSPFITCFNCFELLQLPKKALAMLKNCQQNVRCGACSSKISLSVINKKLIVSPHSEIKGTSARVDESSNELPNSFESHSRSHVKSNGANYSSDDYSGYDFHSVDKETVLPAPDPSLKSGKSQDTPSFRSSSINTSEGKNSPEVMIDPCEVIQSTQQPTMDSLSSPPAGSPLKDYFDYSNNNHAATQVEKGNQSSRLEEEKVIADKIKTRQNSLKDVVLATEMDVHDYCNTGVSEESGDVSRKHDQSNDNKGGDSFIANIIKKSFRDFSRSHDERERSNVTVNGRPLPNSVIKKAEKRAGPIQPGNYWYDFRAGFWGVMGGPCLGIIPPHIEEFSNPMPGKCAGGNTGVFVNGRELHERDLTLLAGRGLPTDRDRSYIIEISGRVLDEDTGDELDCLGKLAPTVEKVKHGFGMKPPRATS